MLLTVDMLHAKGACASGIEDFRAIFGDKFDGDWTPDLQLWVLHDWPYATPEGVRLVSLRKYIGWAYAQKLIPLWSMSGAVLRWADLYGADLRNADLSSADLRNTNLSNTNLRNANLSSADLSSADLYGADLRSADLSSANLYGADLTGVIGYVP